MRLLLDTPVVIWWVDQDNQISSPAHALISDPTNDLIVSAATIWEIAIKVGIGKLSLSCPFHQWMDQTLDHLRATILPITVEYAAIQASLSPHHGDPFDRLLVAQAMVEEIPIVSRDPAMDAYKVKRIW